MPEAVLGHDADRDQGLAVGNQPGDRRQDAVVRSLAARRNVRSLVAVETRVDEVRALESFGVPSEQGEIRVHADPESPLLRQRDDVAEVATHHRLAAGEPEPADAHLPEPVEQDFYARKIEVRRVDEGTVAVRAPEIAPVRDRERRRERPRWAVDHVGEEAGPVGVAERELVSQPHRAVPGDRARRGRSRPS